MTLMVKIKAHRGEPVNEKSDTQAENARQLSPECQQWTTRTQRMTYEWEDSNGIRHVTAWSKAAPLWCLLRLGHSKECSLYVGNKHPFTPEDWFFRDKSPTHPKDVLVGSLSFLLWTIHLPELLSGPCRWLRYHELNHHKVTKSQPRGNSILCH